MPFYGVARGFNIGVYDSWNECKQQVHHYSRAYYRKFDDYDEAVAFVQYNADSDDYSSDGYSSDGYDNGYNNNNGYNDSYDDSYDDDYDSDPGDVHVWKVYIDGASRGNGQWRYPKAGFGVYYGPNDYRNAAIPLDQVDNTSLKPTNQRAELWALNYVLEQIWDELTEGNASYKYEIHSDSIYAINSVTDWAAKWSNNGWLNTRGERISNYDLITQNNRLVGYIDEAYDELGWGQLDFYHDRAHSGIHGNEEADRLANIGADSYGS